MPTVKGSTIIPSLRYRNALAAIDWLERAFGFHKQAVYMGEGDHVMHAQLTYGGSGMVMLGSVPPPREANTYNQLVVQPDEIGQRSTGGICLIVPDADALYATAKSANADIVSEINDASYGGRAFSCRDLEGHLWHVGTYDPWAEQ